MLSQPSQLSTKASTPKGSTLGGRRVTEERKITWLKTLESEERKKEETKFIKKYIGQGRGMYIVEILWSEQYTDYLRESGSEGLRPIDNSKLLEAGKLCSGLKSKKDYYEVSEEIWKMVSSLYGGGPEIRKPLSIGSALPVKGLENKLFSCFINTGVQCLLSVPEFVEYFEKAVYN